MELNAYLVNIISWIVYWQAYEMGIFENWIALNWK